MLGTSIGAAANGAGVGLDVFRDVLKTLRNVSTNSLLDYTKAARVEPVVMVDAPVLFNEDLKPVLDTLLSLFSGTYLQAVALSMNVGQVDVLKTLDKLNPRRDVLDAALTPDAGWLMSEESYQYGLPKYSMEAYRQSLERDVTIMPLRLSEEAVNRGPRGMGGSGGAIDPSSIPSVPRTPTMTSSSSGGGGHSGGGSGHGGGHGGGSGGGHGGGGGDHHGNGNSAMLEQRERHHRDTIEQRTWETNQRGRSDADRLAQQRQQHADNMASRTVDALQREKDQSHRHQIDKDRLKQADRHHEDRLALDKERNKKDKPSTSATVGSETLKTVKEQANLSIGKLLSVEVSDGSATRSVMVQVRLITVALPTEAIIHAFAGAHKDISFKARWHGWKSGRLEFWMDLILMQDLVEAHRAHLIADKDGLFSSIVNVKRKNQLSAMLSGRMSVATASNMAVISQATADSIEYDARISLSNYAQRQKLFEPTSLMILVVMNEQFGRVKMYYRGIPEVTDLSIRDLKTASKGGGPDIAEIMRALQMGSAPRI